MEQIKGPNGILTKNDNFILISFRYLKKFGDLKFTNSII